MDEEKKPELTQASFDEAPASATVKIKSANGFEYLFTLRDEKASTLMFKIKAMEEKWMGLGWAPLAQNAFGKKEKPPVEYLPGQMCPMDGGRLVKPPTGSRAPIKCENSKWNAQTKQAFGCLYKIWPDQQQPKPNYAQPLPERQINEEDFYDR